MIETQMNPIKVKTVLVINAVSIHGTKVVSDFTLNVNKQSDISLSYCELGVLVSHKLGTTLIPNSNIVSVDFTE